MCQKTRKIVWIVMTVGILCSNTANADLVGHWKFDEGSGTVANDSSGNGNHGTLQNDPIWVPGKISSSLQFDGLEDFVEIPHADILTVDTEVTVMAWINTERHGGRSGNWQGIVGKSNNPRSYSFYTRVSGSLHFSTTSGGGYVASLSTGTIPLNEWTHVCAMVVDGGHRYYINGENAGDAQSGIVLPGSADTATVKIGWSASTNHFLGMIDDVRIYNHALEAAEVQQAMKGIPPELASDPSPAHEATDVLREVVLSWEPGEFAAPTNGHKVYFGESFDDVNDAVGGVAQTAASYALAQRLDFGTTYYWRVDEVNAPPTSHVEFKGEVWSFTTEPIGYPIEDVNATASSALSVDTGPENTVNGSGMDADDLHSIEQTDMWVSGSELEGAWIEFEFDRVYKLHEMLVWNSNQMIESIVGFGAKGVTIEYSSDGNDYTILGTTGEFARAPGTPGYAHNTTVDFAGVVAKKVRITISSNWGFLPQYSLSEVRFLYIPVLAREPQPEPGAIDVDVDTTLSWRAGREAAEHNVYIDTDEQAVIDDTADVTTVTEASHGPISLDLGQTYYWKVNEVNDAETPTMWESDIWNFRTQEYFVVENFEDYNDYPGYRIYETWADGYEIPTNGAMIGYPEPLNFAAGEHILETTDVHSGEQSLPFFYDNSTAASSEATVNIADLPIGSDWTGNGVKSLSLWFSGDVNNVPEQMYVKLNGVKVLYDGDAGNLSKSPWQPWNIHLSDFTGVNLSNVTELSIGFERIGFSGGSGMVLFDDIRLYPYERQLITPTEPNNAGLIAHWQLDEGLGTVAHDASGNGFDGTFNGSPQWVAGHIGAGALQFDGIDDSVIYRLAEEETWSAYTVAVWAKAGSLWQSVNSCVFANHMTYAIDTPSFQLSFDSASNYQYHGSVDQIMGPVTTDWIHLAATRDGPTVTLYYNGNLVTTVSTGAGNPVFSKFAIGVNRAEDNWFDGLIDDVRIYDRVLSGAEVGWLGGVTKPFDKPF